MQNTIRKALSADLPAIQALARDTINQCYPAFLGQDAVDGFLGSGASDDYLAEHLPYCWVLMRDEYENGDEKLAAVAVCQEHTIEMLLVHPGYQQRGLGRVLLEQCEGFMSLGHSQLRLESFVENHNAMDFYRHLGWQESQRYADPDSGLDKAELIKPCA